jgi:hypothetical protein
MIKLLYLSLLKVKYWPQQKGIILRGKLIKLVQHRDLHYIGVRQNLDKIVLLKIVELQPLSLFLGVMGQVENILLPLDDLVNAIESEFGQMVETVAEELEFTL